MKKVFVDNLPRIKNGSINWKESIGSKINFQYDNIYGELKITNYENYRIEVEYKNRKKWFQPSHIMEVRIGNLLGIKSRDFKLPLGKIIKEKHRHMLIKDREYRPSFNKNVGYNQYYKWYLYKCLICNYEGWILEQHIMKGVNCSCCAGKTAVLGINTIWDTDRWLVDDFGLDEEFAKTHTHGTRDKGLFTCRDCGSDTYKSINNVIIGKSIGCTCGDGISYPEKFMVDVLKQLDISFQNQLSKTTFEWCDKYKYDFYIPEYNMIIETHGGQHYKEQSIYSRFKRTLQEEQENDRIKKELALKNGIEHYIILDCRYSELDYIKNSILNSELADILNLSKIDWLKCEEFALKNIAKEVCHYWNTTKNISMLDMCINFGYSPTTISKWLKKGTKLGWCNYDSKKEKLRGVYRVNMDRKIAIYIYDVKNGKCYYFCSLNELERLSESILGKKITRKIIDRRLKKEEYSYKKDNFEIIFSTCKH